MPGLANMEYYHNLLKQKNISKISVEIINSAKGKGIIAKNLIEKDDIIFYDEPIVAAQFLYNKIYFPACSFCLKSLETPSDMVARLTDYTMTPKLPLSDSLPSVHPVHCENCDELYCSKSCSENALESYHRVLCPGRNSHIGTLITDLEEEWKSFHFPPETASITLLLRMLAKSIQLSENGHNDESIFAELWNHFAQDYYNEDLDIFHCQFESEYEPKIHRLFMLAKELFYNSKLEEMFTYEQFKKLLGVICLNAQGVGTSAFEAYQRYLMALPDSEKLDDVWDLMTTVEEAISEHSEEFTHCEGSGLYRLQSCLNHSCAPNCEIRFPSNNSTLQVVATRDIEKGEELCIAYLHFDEEEDNTETRRETLQQYYLFHCQCSMCTA